MSRQANLVSVIIPCYNHGKYLGEAIDCILSQTYQNIEIIIVDDGSDNEETLEILRKIDMPKTTVYRKENGGVSSARNFGIKKSLGEYILTLDSDDFFAPSFIQKGLKVLKTNLDIGMVTCNVKKFNEKKTSHIQLKGGKVEDFLLKNHASASLLFRHQCWIDAGGYDQEIEGFADWEFCINVTKHGWSIYSIQDYLFYYRDIEGSMYDNSLKKKPDLIKYMASKHNDIFQKHVVEVIYHKEQRIAELESQIKTYQKSFSVKIGNFFLKPLRSVKKLLR